MINKENKDIFISVVMTVFNAEKTVKQTIESVLRQTHDKIEFIIVDDASTDKTVEIIKSIEDSRIRFLSVDKNRHAAVAANVGLNLIKGDYVAKIDADDYWDEKKLEIQLDYMQKHPECGAYFTKIHLVGENGEDIEALYPDLYQLFNITFDTRREWMQFFVNQGNCLIHPSVLLRTSLIKEVGFHDIFFLQALDFEWWLRILLKSEIRVCEEKLTYYRWENNPDVKISSDGEKSNTRFLNEKFLAIIKLFWNMTDDEFCYFFGEYFRDKDAKGSLALACEKAFYMIDYLGDKGPYALWAVQSLAEIYKQEEGRKLLEEVYHYNIKDGYNIYTQHFFFDTILKEKIEKLKERDSEKNYQIALLEAEKESLLKENEREHKDAYEKGLENERLQNQLEWQKRLREHLEAEKTSLLAQMSSIEEKRLSLLHKVNILEKERLRLFDELSQIFGSHSWKMTKSLRALGNILRSMKQR